MSSDKDKRSSKLFGSRISSIFNVQQGHNAKHVYTSNHGLSNQKSEAVKPLSHPPLNAKPNIPTRAANNPAPHVAPQSQVPSVPLTTAKSPPRRKPPPPMMEDFEGISDSRNMGTEAPLAKKSTSANKYGKEVKEDLNNIIGTLEKEIGSMMVTGDKPTPDPSHGYQFDDGNEASSNLIPEANALDLDTTHQFGDSYYSDYSQSAAEAQISTPVSENYSQSPLEMPDDANFTASDTPVYCFNEHGEVPYPINASLPESPTSPTFQNDMANQPLTMVSDYKSGGLNESRTSITSSEYSQNEEPISLMQSIDTFDSNHSNSSKRQKEYQAAASMSSLTYFGTPSRNTQNTPFIRSTSLQQNRNIINPPSSESASYDTSSKPKPSGNRQNMSHHRKSSSVSSIWSATSYRSIQMSKLKKTLDLEPGEGERSNYVVTIRRNAGTAYNESPPGKWKLPIGILPVDNRIGYNANGRYMRLAGGLTQARNKKTSGVELKHGHLQPRLLAAEVDDGDESPVSVQPLGRSGTDLTMSTSKSLQSGIKSSESSITIESTPSGSLLRNGSFGKTANEDNHSINTGGDSSSTLPSSNKANSVSSSSSSSKSLTNFNIEIGGYYQHPGYLNNDDEETSTELENELMGGREKHRPNDFNDYDARPRLVLANPDSSDESD